MNVRHSFLCLLLLLSACGDSASTGANASSKPSATSSVGSTPASASAKPSARPPVVSGAPSASSASPPAALDLGGACGDLAEKTCARFAACDHGYRLKIAYADDATCRAAVRADCLDGLQAPDAGAGVSEVTACATALAAASCDDLGHVEACRFKGKRAEDAACSVDEQCQSGTCQRSNDTQGCGKCLKIYKAGDACTEGCGPELTCVDSKCAPLGRVGAPCKGPRSCLGSATCKAGTCAAQPLEGDACNVDPNSDSQVFCYFPYGCEGKKCVPRKLANLGEACGAGQGPFCTRSTCDARTQKCVALPGEGEACDAATECAAPLRCLDKHCGMAGKAACP
ncbi:MAG: hypothetical protein U0414_30545 [Polyangiaceae bacterium]